MNTTYTKEQVSAALNAAADLARELVNPEDTESSETILADDTLNLAVNLAGYLLDHPDASTDEAIVASYTDVVISEYDLPDGEAVPERGGARWNELVVSQVRSWFG